MPKHLLRFLAVAAAVLPAGCSSATTTVSESASAPPQRVELHWDEREPAGGSHSLVFRTTSFVVTADGWSATIGIENHTGISWELGADKLTRSFGVMLFETGDEQELDRRNTDGDLPSIRPAHSFSPSLPLVLEDGKVWSGTVSAPGALAAGRFVRLVFGALTSVGDPPAGLRDQLVWITDSAYELRG